MPFPGQPTYLLPSRDVHAQNRVGVLGAHFRDHLGGVPCLAARGRTIVHVTGASEPTEDRDRVVVVVHRILAGRSGRAVPDVAPHPTLIADPSPVVTDRTHATSLSTALVAGQPALHTRSIRRHRRPPLVAGRRRVTIPLATLAKGYVFDLASACGCTNDRSPRT